MSIALKARGISFIELMASLTVVIILLSLALPSFYSMLQSWRIQQASEAMYNDLLLARSEALRQQSTLYVAFQTGSSWCYGLNNSATCTCSTTGSCQFNGVPFSNSSNNYNGVSLSSSGFIGSNVAFEGTRGTVNNTGTFTLSSNGNSINIVINKLGYIQICSSNVSGYNAC